MTGLRKRVVSNAIANYAGAVVTVAAPLITLPMYLHLLGDEQWALIGFVATLQSLAAVLDAGMGQVLVREFALRMDIGGEQRTQDAARVLLASCERFYWLAGAVVAVLIIGASYWIAHHWLDISQQYQAIGQVTVAAAGVLCALQLPALLYRGALVAAQDHLKLNYILAAGAVLRFGGGVAAVAIHPSVVTYLVWHTFSFALELHARSRSAWRAVGGRVQLEPSTAANEMKRVVGGMSVWTAAATIGAISVQVDKSILSAMLPLAELTPYFIASQLAMGSIQLYQPLITAIFPSLMRLDQGHEARMKAQLSLIFSIIAICTALSVFMTLFGRMALTLWLGEQRGTAVMPLLCVLLASWGVNALTSVGYINWLAHDRRVRLLVANVAAILVVALATPLLVTRIGVLGAAVAWLSAQLTVLIISLDWIRDARRHR